MLNTIMNNLIKKNFLPFVLLVLFLSLFRLIPHPSNFTPILAAGIFSGFYFRNLLLGSFIVILSMFIGDLIIGFHSTMIFTYTSLIAVVAIGLFIKKFNFKEIFLSGLSGSVCFFIITNFGAWINLAMYEKNLQGLIQSYILAIPFFHNTLLSTFIYLIGIKLILDYTARYKAKKIS